MVQQVKSSNNKKRRPAGKNSRKRKSSASSRRKKTNINIKMIAGAAVLAVLVIVLVFAVKSCGVSNKTPEKVVKTLVKSYVDGDERKIKKCYGVKKADKNLEKEISATIKYFEVHKPKKAEINSCDTIYKNGKNAYVYITYSLILEDGQSYPCISTYMTQQNEKGKYSILTPSDITDDMKKEAAARYASFMETDPYKEYVTAYDTFSKKNPGYEEKLATKLN